MDTAHHRMYLAALCCFYIGAFEASASDKAMTEAQLQDLQKLQEQQAQLYKSMSVTMPSLTDSALSVVDKLERMQNDRYQQIERQSSELDAKAEEALSLIETGEAGKARLKIASIQWNPIGDKKIDEQKAQHYTEIRGVLEGML